MYVIYTVCCMFFLFFFFFLFVCSSFFFFFFFLTVFENRNFILIAKIIAYFYLFVIIHFPHFGFINVRESDSD